MLKRILSGVLVAAIALTSLPMTAFAQTNNILYGDVNADGQFTITDVVAMQKWLLAVPDAKLSDWKAGDLYEDNVLNVFDLCLMKRLLAEQ